MKEPTEDELKKYVYQSLTNFAEDLRKDIRVYFTSREFLIKDKKPYRFSDVIYKDEFADWLYCYIDETLTKDQFKDKIQQKIAWAHTPYVLNKIH